MIGRIRDLEVSDIEKIDKRYFGNAVRVCMKSEYPRTDWYVLYQNGLASIDLMNIGESDGKNRIEMLMFDDRLGQVFTGVFAHQDIGVIIDTAYSVADALKRFLHTKKGE